MIEQSTRNRFRAFVAAAAIAVSSSLVVSQPVAAQPQFPPTPQLPSPQVTSNLKVRNAAAATVDFGNQFNYRFGVDRAGFSDSRQITVVHTAPPGLTLVSQTPAAGFSCTHTYSTAANRLTCIGTMSASGGSQSANFVVRYRAPGLFEGGNYILSTTVDPNNTISETNESDNTTSATVRITGELNI